MNGMRGVCSELHSLKLRIIYDWDSKPPPVLHMYYMMHDQQLQQSRECLQALGSLRNLQVLDLADAGPLPEIILQVVSYAAMLSELHIMWTCGPLDCLRELEHLMYLAVIYSHSDIVGNSSATNIC